MNLEQLLTPKTLATPHVQDLKRSKISREAAQEAGISTVPPDMISKVLGMCNYGWAAPKVDSMLAFLYRPLNGSGDHDYFRVKVYPPIKTKKGTAKYLQPEGSVNHVYCPSGVEPQGNDTLYITEGEKKAVCLTLQGFPCIGLGGVNGYRTKDAEGNSRVIPDFDLINWHKRDVVIVFDADIAVNEMVEQAETKLAEELLSRKARVFIKRLPYGPGCAKGADDYLVTHGAEAFKKLPAKTVKPKRKVPAQAQGTEPEPAESPRVAMCGHLYFIDRGRLCLETVDREGKPKLTILANFQAQIEEEVTRDDGLRPSKEFHIAGSLDTGRLLPRARIMAKEYDSLNWIPREWGAAAAVAPGRSLGAHLVNAIQAHSQGFKRRTVYAHTGWQKIGLVWRYLHGGGAIGQGDPVEVDLGENLSNYSLPEPGGIEAAQASLRFLDIGPWKITAPLLACVYLAPFADLCNVDFSLWFHGPTGGLKSTLAALALCHFGNFSRTTLPGSWFSTVNSLEKLCFVLKDSLLVIDDFMPAANSKESHRMAESAARLIYQAGNRSGRGRLTADLSARPDHRPRCLIISTGEMLLPGQRQSATARYLGVEFDPEKTPIDMARLTAAQREQALYPQAMAAYLEPLAPHLDDTLTQIQELWGDFRGAFQRTAHLRIPEIQAWLAVGFELFLRFQTIMGAITQDVAVDLHDRAWRVFEALGEKHSRIIEGERPTLKFLAILRELFYQSRVYVESATVAGAPPQERGALGWEGTEPAKHAELVGWAGDGVLYLMPEMTLKVIHETIRRQGDFLSLGKNDLFAALAREGFIEPARGENTQIKWIQGASKRVICLPLVKLADDEAMENERT